MLGGGAIGPVVFSDLKPFFPVGSFVFPLIKETETIKETEAKKQCLV